MSMNKRSVLFVIGKLSLNGACRSLIALLNAIQDEYAISLFVSSYGGEAWNQIPKSVKILPEISIYKAWRESLRDSIKESLGRKKWRVIIYRCLVAVERALRLNLGSMAFLPKVVGSWDLVCGYTDGFVAELVAKKIDGTKRKVSWVHQNYEDDPIPQRSLRAFAKLDGAVGVSEDAVRHFKNAIGERFTGETHVVHNITDAELVRRLSEDPLDEVMDHRYNVVTVGRVSPEKGYAVIPKTIKLLVDCGLDVGWKIVGPHLPLHEAEVMAEATKLGVGGRLKFVGAKSNPYPLVKACDCYVQTSTAEGWGMSISEALILGKPVVCTNLPVFAEQVKDGENGYLVEWTPEAFVEKIVLVLSGKSGLAPSKINKLPFTVENVKREFARLLESL